MLNLNRPELDFNHRSYLKWSPLKRKHFFVTSNLFKNGAEKKRNAAQTSRLNEMIKIISTETDSIDDFQRGIIII
jgi:hypothetical protein